MCASYNGCWRALGDRSPGASPRRSLRAPLYQRARSTCSSSWLSLLMCATLSLRLTFSAGYLSFSACSLHLSLRLSAHLSLRFFPPRTLSFCFSPDRRVCHHLSLRLSLSSFRPRLYWRSQKKSTTTFAVSAYDVQRPPAYLSRFNTCW